MLLIFGVGAVFGIFAGFAFFCWVLPGTPGPTQPKNISLLIQDELCVVLCFSWVVRVLAEAVFKIGFQDSSLCFSSLTSASRF